MGGKHKVANRTKNNARPSSSGRSAELLGTSIPQFVGFSGIKETVFPTFSASNTEELETALDANVQLVLKKISKKDSTTKLKGLQEFAELVKNTESDAVKALLPVWPRFYNLLATDTDNRVREAAHNVHHQIVLKAKRNIAPFLKQLIAPWFTSQYDTYPPAASAAIQAFKDAFPVHKFQEAIFFCQEEILSYIKDNLLIQTPETLASKHTPNSEEAEAKYERVVTSCLQGYYLYLEKVPSEKIEEASALNVEIISNNKFWKFAKHKVPPVRAAWFKVLIVICQKAIFLLSGKETQATTTVFNNLDENEPLVLPYVWESALLLVSSIPEYWKYLNVEKMYFPKLWKILKQGGQGNATVIYPNLLPLLSHLPPMSEENAMQFFSNFFENIRIGLKQKPILASRSESSAVAQSFIECLQYVIMKNQSDTRLCKTLIKSHLISTLEWCLTDETACDKVVFNHLSTLVQSWSRNTSFSVFIEFFFDNVKELFKVALYNFKDTQSFDCVTVATKQIVFLQSLKHIHKPKKQGKVKFACEDEPLCDSVTKKVSQSSLSTDESYLKNVSQIVFEVGEEYVKFIEEKREKRLMDLLCSLVSDFDKKSFFDNLNEKLKKKDSSSRLIDIYTNLLKNWLESSDLFCQEVVNLVFMLSEFLPDEDRGVILEDLLSVPSDDCLEWSISEALSHPHNKDRLVLDWLKSPRISNFFVSIAEKQINNTCTPSLGVIFKLALTENENGELFVQKEVMSRIIKKLTETLLSQTNQSASLDTCSSLAAYISTIIYTENVKLTYGDELFITLFKFSCQNFTENDYLSNETIYEVNSAWQDAVTVLSKTLDKAEVLNLTSKCAEVIETEFTGHLFTKSYIEHIGDIIIWYLRAVYKSVPLSISELLGVFFDRKWVYRKDNIVQCCQIAEYVAGNLSSPYKEVTLQSNVSDLEILQYFVWSYLKLRTLATDLEDSPGSDDDQFEEEGCSGDKDAVLFVNVVDNVEENVLSALYDYTLGESFLLNYNNTKYYQDCLHYNTLLEDKLKSAIKNLHSTNMTNIKSLLKEKSLNEAWFWCTATYNYYTKVLLDGQETENLAKIYEDLTNGIAQQTVQGALHLTQVFKENISYDNVHWKYGKLGSTVVLRSLICSGEELDVQIAGAFSVMEELRNENVPQFLYDNANNISAEKVEQIIEAIRTCSALMEHNFAWLSRRHWDFGVLSLVSWSSNCVKARALYTNYQFQALLIAVTNLYIATDNQIAKMIINNEKNNYIDEWQDVLVESVHADLAQIWLYLAEQFSECFPPPLTFLSLIQQFGAVTDHVSYKFLFKPMENYPKWTKFSKRSCSLLSNSTPALQLWGYKMLLALVPGLIEMDTESVVNTNSAHRKGLIFEQFKDILGQTNDVVTSMLMEFRLGEDTCRVEPSTDSYTYTFAYLLLWDVILTLCDQSGTELKYQYADWLKNEDLFKIFLNNLVCLMPSEVLHFSEGKSKSLSDYFLQKPFADGNCYSATCDSDSLERFVCHLFAASLMQLPALVRQWWTGLDTRGAQIIEKITSLYVSPHLCREELNDVTQHQTKFKNMTIKVIPSVREVLAVYTVDEATMELAIILPPNYPLGSPEVQCNRQIGGTTHKQWLLQLKKCILHQNGRIWDGLSLWNSNLDKKFDGVEECYICFAVLHAGTYQLPKLSCQTCKKKFHSACLYKWFATSNKSTCPICRNLF